MRDGPRGRAVIDRGHEAISHRRAGRHPVAPANLLAVYWVVSDALILRRYRERLAHH
jgi:hypothetical protein